LQQLIHLYVKTLKIIDLTLKSVYSAFIMAKKITKIVKSVAIGGKATPAPPLGPVLGQAGIDISGFCTAFNDATKDKMGQKVPIVITVYDDRSYTFIMKEPPASELIKEAAGLTKGSSEPNKTKVAQLTKDQLRTIAEKKMTDLNARDIDAAMLILAGTARSMGVTIAV
jgi:large subunit ribosomal protein L11